MKLNQKQALLASNLWGFFCGSVSTYLAMRVGSSMDKKVASDPFVVRTPNEQYDKAQWN